MIRATYLFLGSVLGAFFDELLRSVWLHEATLAMRPLTLVLLFSVLVVVATEINQK